MEVAALVVGIIALVVGVAALPTILQMIFGRPFLTFEADEFTGSESKILVIAIKNRPIKNRFLQMMGVERDAGDVLAFFDIIKQGTNEIIAKNISGKLHCAPERTEGLKVPVLPGFTTGLMIVATKNGSAALVDGRSDLLKPIGEGHYAAFISVIRGEKTYNIMQRFQIEKEDHRTIWYSRDVIKTR